MVSEGGLIPGDPERLRCALSLLAPECEEPPECAAPGQTCADVDSDGDGMSDVEELRALRDPNAENGDTFCGPKYGCGAHVVRRRAAQRDGTAAGWAALLVALALLLRKRAA
jgi:hypothetical protein